jgi:hypothetical protein
VSGAAGGSPPLIGVNLPWFGQGYGHDLGRNASHPGWPPYFDPAAARRLLELLAARGVRLLRIWLFEDAEGLELDAAGRVTGIDSAFAHNLGELAALLRELRFRVYWVLLDANSVGRRNDAVTRSVLIDPEATARFCRHALAEVLPGVSDLAWGVDLCNEPEALIAGETGNNTGLGFEWWQIRPALLRLRAAASRSLEGVPASVGSGYQEHRNVAAGVLDLPELDFLDFHSHGMEGPPAHAGAVAPGRPVVIGELGVSVPAAARVRRRSWLAAQRQLVRSLHDVLWQGYQAVFLWYASDLEQADAAGLVFRNETGLALDSLADLEAAGLIRLRPDRVAARPASGLSSPT